MLALVWNIYIQALFLSVVFTLIALINVSCAALQSRVLLIMEFMSLATLSLTVTLSLYFTDVDSLSAAAQVRGDGGGAKALGARLN